MVEDAGVWGLKAEGFFVFYNCVIAISLYRFIASHIVS